MREANLNRKTKETDISIQIKLDEKGESNIKTGIGFFDHMLELFAFHSGIYLYLQCNGDIKVDGHHSIEDIGILLGKAINEAIRRQKRN